MTYTRRPERDRVSKLGALQYLHAPGCLRFPFCWGSFGGRTLALAPMGLAPRSPNKAGRRFPAGGKRGRGAKGSGRPRPGRQRPSCSPPDGRSEPALEAHSHLSSEAIGYFRRALSALKEAPETGEERGGEQPQGGTRRDSLGINSRTGREIFMGPQGEGT